MKFDITKLSKTAWVLITLAVLFNGAALIMFILLVSWHEQCKAKPTDEGKE